MIEIMQTMLSYKPKRLFLKIEMLVYDVASGTYVPIDTAIIDQDAIPNHLTWDGSLTVDVSQEVPGQLNLTLANAPTPYGVGQYNWGAFFNPETEFKLWLDKRVRLSIGVKLDTPYIDTNNKIVDVGWIPKGIYALVNFSSNHTLTEFPAVQVTASSLECLFTGKRGKFLNPTTLTRHTVATEAIKTLVKSYIPDDIIRIDPSLGLVGDLIEKGESIDEWAGSANCTVELSDEFMYGMTGVDKSILISADKTVRQPQTLATKILAEPFNISQMDSVALWVRTSRSFYDAELAIRFIDTDGNQVESGFLETVGHVVNGEEIIEAKLDNWRNMLLSLTGFEDMQNIVQIDIFLTREVPPTEHGFQIWIDNIYTAQNKTTLPYELSYGAGSNRWQAIKEIGEIIDADIYFDNAGNFIVRKRRIPKVKQQEYYNFDRYEVPIPKITFKDTLAKYNLYAGTDSTFMEYELANHTQALGGASYQPIPCYAEFALRVDGLHLKERGMKINSRGKPRYVDATWIYNGDTDVEEIYSNDKQLDTIVLDYPKPPSFQALVEPPVSNFAIERIGDMIYHHNNATYDPVIMYAYECKNRALWELKKRLAYAEQLSVHLAPYYLLDPYDIVRIEDKLLGLNDNFELKGLEIPLNGSVMTAVLHKIRNAVIDIPFFDENYTKRSTSWYNYDFYALAFTFPSWERRRW